MDVRWGGRIVEEAMQCHSNIIFNLEAMIVALHAVGAIQSDLLRVLPVSSFHNVWNRLGGGAHPV